MEAVKKPFLSWSRVIGGLIVIAVLTVVTLVGYASAKVYRVSKIQRHFGEIHKGQTKQEVLNILGSPDETTDCRSDDRECVETFWYYGFIERWMIYFDRYDRVIDVNYNVSP